jgi:hypothetical protein
MANFTSAAGTSGNLFEDLPARAVAPPVRPRMAPALRMARDLCRQFRNKQPLPDKQRIAHLICLNLVSMLRHDSQSV